MRRIAIVLFAAAALVLLRAPHPAQAQIGGTLVGCWASSPSSADYNQYCNTWCKNGPGSIDNYQTYYTNENPGLVGIEDDNNPTCGGVKPDPYDQANASANNDACQAGGGDYLKGTPNATACCPLNGGTCAGGQCCYGETCYGNTCITCVAWEGNTCNACGGTYDCAGNCPACNNPPPPSGCQSDADCASGQSCDIASGVCQTSGNQTCYQNSDCSPGCTCISGSCDCSGSNGSGGSGCVGDYQCGTGEYCNTSVYPAECEPAIADPIIVDLSGQGFPMTNLANGVLFNFFSRGLVKVSWTQFGANVGWLALPQGGVVANGSELFGNYTAQPNPYPKAPSGFRALAVLDTNHDGVINSKDPAWPQLRLWVDSNHDGISQPSEILTMAQAGLTAISTHWSDAHFTDPYGNQFHNRVEVLFNGGTNKNDRYAYDVTLVTH